MAKANKKGEVTYDLEEVYGYLDEGRKVYARISWNGEPAKDEVRRVWKDKEGNLKVGKGIELKESEIKELVALLDMKPKPVNFSDIFKSTKGITEKRRNNQTTVDGFIVLRKHDGSYVGH